MMKATHYAFSDDSKHKDGVFCSLALVTLEKKNFPTLNKKLKYILKKSGITKEFKWEQLRNAKYKFAAENIINFVFENRNLMRIDIIIWDLKDKRHKNVLRRDDEENLVRMYYHLLSSTVSKSWPIQGSLWKWFPDQQSSVNWNVLKECINNKKHNCISDLFMLNPNFEQVQIVDIEPSKSDKKLFIQVADLFTGMGAYSYGSFAKFINWKKLNTPVDRLFTEEAENSESDLSFSNKEKYRFQIIDYFNKKAKQHKLQISFERTKGFKSHNPRKFINFWLYEPQSENDKAPQKKP